MKKGFLSFFKKESEKGRGERVTVNTEFAKSINLDESFEDMFPGEKPDEVRYYDIHGNEVERK